MRTCLSLKCAQFSLQDGGPAQHRDDAEFPDHIDAFSERQGFWRGGRAPGEMESREKVRSAFDEGDIWEVSGFVKPDGQRADTAGQRPCLVAVNVFPDCAVHPPCLRVQPAGICDDPGAAFLCVGAKEQTSLNDERTPWATILEAWRLVSISACEGVSKAGQP